MAGLTKWNGLQLAPRQNANEAARAGFQHIILQFLVQQIKIKKL